MVRKKARDALISERPRSTQSEAWSRRARVEELHSQGHTLKEIVSLMKEEADPSWGLTPINSDVVKEDVQACNKRFKEEFPEVQVTCRRTQYARCEAIYKMAYAEGNWMAALKALERQAKVVGSDAPEKSQVQIEVTQADKALLRLFNDEGDDEVIEAEAEEVWGDEEMGDLVLAAEAEEKSRRLL